MILFLFSGRFEISRAPNIAAPDDMPHRIPSSFASLRAVSMASSFDTFIISSKRFVSRIFGIKPAPIP